MGTPVTLVDPNGQYVDASGGGGGGPATVTVDNFPATQTVSGTVTVSALATAGSTQQGAIANAAYSDATGVANGTMISLLKGIFVQQAAMIALLEDIKTNTTPIP